MIMVCVEGLGRALRADQKWRMRARRERRITCNLHGSVLLGRCQLGGLNNELRLTSRASGQILHTSPYSCLIPVGA